MSQTRSGQSGAAALIASNVLFASTMHRNVHSCSDVRTHAGGACRVSRTSLRDAHTSSNTFAVPIRTRRLHTSDN